MDVTADLIELRAEAESMMTDYCIVVRAGESTGTPVLDPATGLYPAVADDIIYTGPCLIRVPGTVSTGKSRPTSGDNATLQSSIFATPWNAPRLEIKDRVMFAASEFNPNLVGMVYTVTGLLPGSQPTKQRVTVEAVID